MEGRLIFLGTGSSGNCIYLELENKRIILDLGISMREIGKRSNINLGEIDDVLITHEHSDHVSSIGTFNGNHNAKIHMSEGTFLHIHDKIRDYKKIKILKDEKDFRIGDLHITPFEKLHDANEPMSFFIRNKNLKMAFMSDTPRLNEKLLNQLAESDIIFLESNHDSKMLERGPYPYYLKKRIKEIGHMSNDMALETIERINKLKKKKRKIILGHISKTNNTYSKVEDVFSKHDIHISKREEPFELRF